MEQQANGIDTPLDIRQDRICNLVRVALDEAHRIPKRQGAHHVVAVVDADLIDHDGFAEILANPDEKVVCKPLDTRAVIRECLQREK